MRKVVGARPGATSEYSENGVHRRVSVQAGVPGNARDGSAAGVRSGGSAVSVPGAVATVAGPECSSLLR